MQLRNTKKKYTVFGLNVDSEIILDELMLGEGPADIEIVYGRVQDEICNPMEKNIIFQASARELLLNIPGVSKYLMSDGNIIVVEPYAGASYSAVKLYLLGTMFGSLLLLRGLIPIHCCAVLINGKCILISGSSGAGKSTLLLALRAKGYPYLTDDVAVLKVEEGTVLVQPGYPQQKIWQDSADLMGIKVDSLAQVSLKRGDKYFLPAWDHFYQKPAKLAAIFELDPQECPDVCVQQLERGQKLAVLMKHTYRIELLSYFGIVPAHFQQCAKVANITPVYQLIRPIQRFSIEEQIAIIRDLI